MQKDAIDRLLLETFEDERLTRSERRDLREPIRAGAIVPNDLPFWRHRAFAIARSLLESHDPARVVIWLEEVTKALVAPPVRAVAAEAHFSPGAACRGRLHSLITGAHRSLDVCVFTLTDDRLSDALLDAQRRRVAVRLISDNLKASDLGNDVARLANQGIAVRVDRTRHHMHHKFALVDGATLVTGSYNWTRSAYKDNQENIVVSDDSRLVSAFQRHFEVLWDAFELP